MRTNSDVLIVGAGPAGLGCGAALKRCGIDNVLIMDKSGVGASFEAWPRQMQMLTPSVHGNASGTMDLNAITPCTSPAEHLGIRHPTGVQYSFYLKAIAHRYELRFLHAEARSIQRSRDGFLVDSSRGLLTPRFIIWAAGEFGLPDTRGIAGAALCLHSSKVCDWSVLQGEKFAIVGGSESGIDAAIQLVWLGKEVHLLSRGEPWAKHSSNADSTLSSYTREELKHCICDAPGSLSFHKHTDITQVAQVPGGYELTAANGYRFHSATPPILATGFRSSMECVGEHFEWEDGHALLDESTGESTLVPGLFYSGPSLMRSGEALSFIHQFRSRFGIIARTIAERMGRKWQEPLRLWRECGFMIENPDRSMKCQCAGADEARIQTPLPEHAVL